MIGLIVSLGLILSGAQFPPPPPPTPMPRDAPAVRSSEPATAIIRGRVTDRETGQPLARATVTLMSRAISRSPQEGPHQTRTAPDGSYEFQGLPAGEYTLTVSPNESRPTHVPQSFGETGPPDAALRSRPRPFTLAPGEIREDVNLALWRAFAIEGRVVDEFGEPMAGVHMMPKIAATGDGAPMPGPYQFFTDDRGTFRIFGLRPGRYLVCANPRTFSMAPRAEIRERAIETCHPAATTQTEAQEITVSSGDVGGVEIRVQRSRAFNVSGVALDSAGAPLQRNQVQLMRIERNGSAGSGIQVSPNGQFVARGLVPGEYAISVNTAPPRGPDDIRDGERAHVPFRIDNSDVEGLVVVARKTSTVTGRVLFEDATQNPPRGTMRVVTMPDMSGRVMMMGPPPTGPVGDDLGFELKGLFEPVAVDVAGVPPGWIVKSVRYRAQDVTDTFVDFTSGREGERLDIVLTNRVARLTGQVIDDMGNAAPHSVVMIMPADPARWNVRGATRGRTSAGADGTFKAGPLRAGEYLIVALDGDRVPMMGMRTELKYIERLAAVAQRITLAESDSLVIELRLAKLQ